MSFTLIAILVATVFLAYANGANDNFKGVATLAGSGTTTYRGALIWATVTTLAGSLLAVSLASGLLKAFSGKGLVPTEVLAEPAFMAAVGLGAAATVLIATRVGLPISTTHSLIGALVGVGLLAGSGRIDWLRLVTVFAIPLLVSPLIAFLLAAGGYVPLRWLRRRLGISAETCVCLGRGEYAPVTIQPDGTLVARGAGRGLAGEGGGLPVLDIDDTARCVQRYQGRVMGVSAAAVADGVHYLSAGAVSLARGLNDTPKIMGLLVASQLLPARFGMLLVGVAIAIGGVLSARRVAATMSQRITSMNVGQALTANLTTAVLVLFASRLGVPVSTTHVSCGSLFGIGAVTGQGHPQTITRVILSWVATLPLAALLGVAAYAVLH